MPLVPEISPRVRPCECLQAMNTVGWPARALTAQLCPHRGSKGGGAGGPLRDMEVVSVNAAIVEVIAQ